MLHNLFFNFVLGKTIVGIAYAKTCFGIGFDIQPYVGWYIEIPGAAPDVFIPGTGYLLGKLFQKQPAKVFYKENCS